MPQLWSPEPYVVRRLHLTATVAIATVTLVRNAREDALVRQSLLCLSSLGLPIVVADGGSPNAFVRFVSGLPNTEVASSCEDPGLVGQARLSLRQAAASGSSMVLYTEPDKGWFFRHHLAEFLAASTREPAAVVLASRSAGSLLSYAASQQFSEMTLNKVCEGETGLVADYSYGPFLARPQVIAALDDVPATLGWGWRPYLFVWAHRRGYELGQVEGGFDCPLDQRIDDDAERHHRLQQLAQNLSGVVLALKA